MKDAPKEIWAETLNDWVGPGGYWDTSPNADSDLPDVKYIRADIAADRIEQLKAENARLNSQIDLLRMNTEADRARDKIGRRGLHPKVSTQIQEGDKWPSS